MDGPVLFLLLYLKIIIHFLVCGSLHMSYIIIYHTIFSITARPLLVLAIPVVRHQAGSGGALNQRRRAGMLSHAAQFRGYSSSVGPKRGESDSVPVNTFHVEAI